MVSRIAIFGDVHGNSDATARTLAAIDAIAPDAVYCLGDLVGYGARPSETINLVRARAIPTIMGNYDDGVGFDRDDCGCAYRDDLEREWGQRSLKWSRGIVDADRKAYLRGLLSEIRLDTEGLRVRMVHGSPRRRSEYLFEDRDDPSLERIAAGADCDVLVFRHTYVPWSWWVGGVLFVNAGSAGTPKDGDPRACWVFPTLGAGRAPDFTYHRVDYDIDAMAEAIRWADGPPDHYARDLETAGAHV